MKNKIESKRLNNKSGTSKEDNWPSKTGNPSGKGRSNGPSRTK